MEPPLHEQLEALQLLKTEDFEGEPGKDDSLERAQREKDEMADRLIMMYGGGEAGRDVDKRTSQPLSRQTSRAKDASYPVKDASHPLKSQRSMTSQSRPRSRATRSGDVLESRSHVFTATEKDFSPRILNKPKATSRLSQSKHYFRPKPKPPIKPSMFAGEIRGGVSKIGVKSKNVPPGPPLSTLYIGTVVAYEEPIILDPCRLGPFYDGCLASSFLFHHHFPKNSHRRPTFSASFSITTSSESLADTIHFQLLFSTSLHRTPTEVYRFHPIHL